MRELLDYILYENDISYNNLIAGEILEKCLQKNAFDKEILTISDEQFFGSPWDNAALRKVYFNRLNNLFPEAKYILVLREQVSMTQSLYLQYIKSGGTANWRQFLTHKKHPLQFSLKDYLNYGVYYQYIINKVDRDNVCILNFDHFKKDQIKFLIKLSNFIGFQIKSDINHIVKVKSNPSIGGYNARFLRICNKLLSSERFPFQLLPRVIQKVFFKLLISTPQIGSKNIIPNNFVEDFCESVKVNNALLPKDINL